MGKRYAISDLHGHLDLFNQVKEYISDDDIVYALGDFGDRGPHPWKTLQSVLDDEQFVYLMGNHDLMLLDAIKDYKIRMDTGDTTDIDRLLFQFNGVFADLRYNGGLPTFEGWAAEPNRWEYYEKLLNLPLEIRLAALDGEHFIYLTHAGYTPGKSYRLNIDDFVWDRVHFYNHWDNLNRDVMFHGHTIIPYLIKQLPKDECDTTNGYCIYDYGNKIDIDMGTHITNQTVLVNIDTLESIVFKGEENGSKEN